MDHRLVEDENIAELYATGRLSPEDEEIFETHLLECTECRERVSWADDMRGSIRAVAAEDAARATFQLGFLAGLVRRVRSARTGLVMAALLAAIALPLWLQADRARLQHQLEEARETSNRPTAPAPAPTPAPAPAEGDRQALIQAETRLREALAENESLGQKVAQLTQPQVNTPVFPLGVVRGETGASPIELGPTPEWIVLSLELPQVEYDTYQVTLRDARGKAIWKGDGLKPTASDTLTILLYSDQLQPGASYAFHLEGVTEGGRKVPAGEIPFRAT
ncbi:MAG TPA: zf-HC2 domain-containing protein, partial [Thermoanaerobaculia bacterium]|nr:zf-HC2 domain-containing protein [Thermoanaerobaculia bacterium]